MSREPYYDPGVWRGEGARGDVCLYSNDTLKLIEALMALPERETLKGLIGRDFPHKPTLRALIQTVRALPRETRWDRTTGELPAHLFATLLALGSVVATDRTEALKEGLTILIRSREGRANVVQLSLHACHEFLVEKTAW